MPSRAKAKNTAPTMAATPAMVIKASFSESSHFFVIRYSATPIRAKANSQPPTALTPVSSTSAPYLELADLAGRFHDFAFRQLQRHLGPHLEQPELVVVEGEPVDRPLVKEALDLL